MVGPMPPRTHTHTHAHTRTHAHKHTQTHTNARTRTHTHAHAPRTHIRTHTHTQHKQHTHTTHTKTPNTPTHTHTHAHTATPRQQAHMPLLQAFAHRLMWCASKGSCTWSEIWTLREQNASTAQTRRGASESRSPPTPVQHLLGGRVAEVGPDWADGGAVMSKSLHSIDVKTVMLHWT